MGLIHNINKPTPANIGKLIGVLVVVQASLETTTEEIPYLGYIKLGLSIIIGGLAVFTGTKKWCMKVYIKDNRLIFGKYEIPTGHYIIEWDHYVGETPESFRFLSVGSNAPLPIFLSTFVKITDCESGLGVKYTGYDDFIAAIGSFFVRALTVAEGELYTRITNLESNETIYQVFSFTGTAQTGTITIPQEATM